MIEQLSNKHTLLHRMSTALYVSQSQDQDMVLVVLNHELPKVYNVQQQLTDMDRVLHLFQKHGIQMTLDEAMMDRGYRKASLKLHPDKGGNKEDFQFFKEFRDKFNNHDANHDLAERRISSTEVTIQKACYYSSMTFKTLDIGVNIARAYHHPTAHNVVDIAIGGSHLLGITTGITKFATAASAISVNYTCYESGIYEGAKSALVSAAFIVTPYALTLAGAPYVATVYTVALTVYSAYSLVNNAWSLHDELYILIIPISKA